MSNVIASYNMSFASGLGYDPRRTGVFESEGNFLMKNVEEQEKDINLKRYWENAMALVLKFWKDKNPIFMGFQEMNAMSPPKDPPLNAIDVNVLTNGLLGGIKYTFDELNKSNGVIKGVVGEIAAPHNGKTALLTVWNGTYLGDATKKEVYDLGKEDGVNDIGRPILIVYTEREYLLINLHAPNKPNESATGYELVRKRIEDRVKKFLQTHSITNINDDKIFVVGDFNDRYNGLGSELKLILEDKEVTLNFQGNAPKSCCYNWDSACSRKREIIPPLPTNTALKNMNARTCTVPDDVITAGINDDKPRKPMGDEGYLKNYKYTGDYCFAKTPQSDLIIYSKQDRDVSSESDHELVYLDVNITESPQPAGLGEPTQNGGSKKRRARKSLKKIPKRKQSTKRRRKSRK